MLIVNAEFIMFNAEFIVFNTKTIIFNTKFIIFNSKFTNQSRPAHSTLCMPHHSTPSDPSLQGRGCLGLRQVVTLAATQSAWRCATGAAYTPAGLIVVH